MNRLCYLDKSFKYEVTVEPMQNDAYKTKLTVAMGAKFCRDETSRVASRSRLISARPWLLLRPLT